MLTKTFAPLLSFVLLATAVQALPQFEATSADGPAKGPPQLVLDVPSPPPPHTFTGAMLVNDAAHPYRAPGLWLPRDGVATPAQIIVAVQEGFNMASEAARTATYTAHLLNGNLEYDLLSIGAKTPKTGPDPPAPAAVGGLNKHNTFEGDVSFTRADAFFGDNFSFNAPLFEQFKNFSMVYGNGFFNNTVAAELRFHRIQQSISENPEFEILGFRHGTAYAEAAFISAFFVDGRKTGAKVAQLDMVSAEMFFKDGHFPEDFHRPAAPVDGSSATSIFLAHPTQPGRNVNGVNTFEVDASFPSVFVDTCGFYEGFITQKVVPLYPNPTGQLRKNLMKNLDFFHDTIGGECEQIFPYGQD